MKSIRILYLVVALISMIACGSKTNEPKGLVSKSETAPDVLNAVVRLNNAMINPTADALDKIAADELTYGHSGGNIQDKTEFIEDLVHGPFSFESIDISDQTVNVVGDVAVVRHIFNSEASDGGTPVHIHMGIVLIFQKQDGEWKLLARQAYKL